MVDKTTKQKLKSFWCVTLCAFVAFNFSIIKMRSVLQADQAYNEFKQAELVYKAFRHADEASRLAYKASRLVSEVSSHTFKLASRESMEAFIEFRQAQESGAFWQASEASRQASEAFRQASEASRHAFEASRQASEMASDESRQAIRLADDKSWQVSRHAFRVAFKASRLVDQMYRAVFKQVFSVYPVSTSDFLMVERLSVLQSQKFEQELSTLGISTLCFIIMLILSLRQRNQISLSLTGQLICLFPEECVAELEALRLQLKSEDLSTWLIRVIILWNFLQLFFAFYVQINIENLWLPQHKGHKKH